MKSRVPQRVVVVGAGAVGLSCAWFLQEHGAEVTVLDRSGVGAAASWGNAGYVIPAMAAPLPEPALLRAGVRGLLTPGSPLAMSRRVSATTLAFLAGFARNSTGARWRRGLAALAPLGHGAIPAFDDLLAGGVAADVREETLRIGFTAGEDTSGIEHELLAAREVGQHVSYRTTAGHEAPFSHRVEQVLHLEDQRFVEPGPFLDALAASVRERGGEIVDGALVRSVGFGPRGLQADTWAGTPHRADAVVLATGTWLPELARPFGVRVPVQSGHGYSCTVALDEPVTSAVYLPGVRVAMTPYGDRLRVTGIMDVAGRDAPFDRRRLDSVLRSIHPLIDGADFSDVRDPWIGARPLTPDGLPLIGRTKVDGVHVAGGHGMYGVTYAPVTGKLLARQVMTGVAQRELGPFDPLR
ncbi:NAD(P)/FAD-dependent oxidoreductase [Lentzea albida]|uniref:D-amino-acid dehydrogenase n=1 Tax=Lentzea albida TaxID=65499 RepID=A0A1H9WE65_9PSEU|nr:FAD-dependent oxidoreductase [Lentzea albida]SES32212.1 D-amino-acid dehydrogenase [Lentzea albida]